MEDVIRQWLIPFVVGLISSILAYVLIKVMEKIKKIEIRTRTLIALIVIAFLAGIVLFSIQVNTEVVEKEKTLHLSQAPPIWGKTIPGSSGKVIYFDNFQGAFSGRIELKGLAPNHSYVLTLNEKLGVNNKLPNTYIDFLMVVTNEVGYVNSEFDVKLPSGNYNVKFFVKDTEDWKIVLYNDFLIFTVR